MSRLRLSLILILECGLAVSAAAGTRYATTPAVEPDRCATAWAIREYVDSNATFEFYPEDEIPQGVVPFDLPDAELRRDARRSTLEVLIERQNLTDPFVLYLGRMIHDIEIRSWARTADAPSIDVERQLMSATHAAPDPAAALAACSQILDEMHRRHAGQ